MGRELWEGNQAMAEAAVRAGVEAYFGYPITPQTELLEWMSWRMPELGRVFLQAESELAAINMVYGAACTGKRVMTTSSSPGVSLMMEGLSYIAGTEVPMVLIDVMRGGPGLGNIAPSQGDYFQIVYGGGHGDFQPIVLAPASVQEAIDMTGLAFDLAEKYRTIAVVLVDGSIGQMMEPAEMPPMRPLPDKIPSWAVSGAEGRQARRLSSIYMEAEDEEVVNLRLLKVIKEIEKAEVRFKGYFLESAQIVIIGFGTAGRVALSAVRSARAEGIPVGLLRPISLSPFPTGPIQNLSAVVDTILVVEMNAGQMLRDVERAVGGRVPIEFYGRMGGVVPFPDEILGEIRRIWASIPMKQNENYYADWMSRLESVIEPGG